MEHDVGFVKNAREEVMKMAWKTALLAAATVALGGMAQRSWAATPVTVDITVSMIGSLSVSVDGEATTTRVLGPKSAGALVVIGSSVTVLNDSSGFTERWQLNSGDSANWTLITSTSDGSGNALPPGADEFVLQALFKDSGADNSDPATWGEPSIVTNAVQFYTDALFSSKIGAGNGEPDTPASGNMFSGNERALMLRLYMPSSDGTGGTSQTITLTITAFGAG